jgi:hypothetical protein
LKMSIIPSPTNKKIIQRRMRLMIKSKYWIEFNERKKIDIYNDPSLLWTPIRNSLCLLWTIAGMVGVGFLLCLLNRESSVKHWDS